MDTPGLQRDDRNTAIHEGSRKYFASITLHHFDRFAKRGSMSCQGLAAQIVANTLVLGNVRYLSFWLP